MRIFIPNSMPVVNEEPKEAQCRLRQMRIVPGHMLLDIRTRGKKNSGLALMKSFTEGIGKGRGKLVQP